MNLEQQVRDKFVLGNRIYDSGSESLNFEYPEGLDALTASACVIVHDKSKAYLNAGISYYTGLYFSDGDKVITLKPIQMWRDGRNQYNDKPWNRWFVRSFMQSPTGYHIVLRNSANDEEVFDITHDEIASA